MRRLEVFCPNYGKILFVGKELHKGNDALVLSNCNGKQPDALLFFDSRGISKEYEGSLAGRIVDYYEQLKMTYLMIVRPLELTTWATFVNFMNANKISPGKIITNMGFVDFTPKKKSILLDAIQQAEYCSGDGSAAFDYKCNYRLSSGVAEPLYGMSYLPGFVADLECLISNHKVVVMNTPAVRRDIEIKRSRPASFFEGLLLTNEFNDKMESAQVVNFPLLDSKYTYDAVHYTNDGNSMMFEIVKKAL